ncbi:PBP1A family penicillin-binding protein [Ruthenibacterium sp. TH_2024_36131]|uniref:transglycosylase domain-containing protein n=1 Tax=Owariibacterium komagatae TaxID=3136601 RepID=UPI0038B23DD4
MLPEKRNIRLPESYQKKVRPARPPQETGAFETPIALPEEEEDHLLETLTSQQEPESSAPPPKKKLRGHEKKLKEGRKKHRWIWLLIAVMCCFMLICSAVLGVYLVNATQNDFLWLDLEQLPHRDATILYAQNRTTGEWEEYARLESTQQKKWVSLSDIPEDMQHAFVAVEDRDFYEHHGVSWKRTIFAVLNEVKKMITGTYFGGEDGIKQGASTITQQLVKNLTRDEESSGIDGYFRKVREIWRALRLDATYDKDQILEAYLNVISFTGNTAGVEAESIKLLGKSASELSLAQCASIAAITKNPTRYDPVSNPDTHLSRRNYILYEMWQQGYITEEEYNTASAEPIGLSPGYLPVNETPVTSYFTDKVLDDVSAALREEYGLNGVETTNLLYNGGLRIYTTVDPQLQEQMENAMLYGNFFPQSGLGVKTTAYVYDEDGSRVVDENGNPVTEEVIEYPQAAMVSVDYEGRLCAVVGGLGEKEVSRGFNRGTDALRQVGSTMKPIGAYALALQQDKITWSTPFLDAPVRQIEDENTGEMKDWPANFSKTYSEKNMLVADALAQSINTVAVRVGELAGVNNIYRFVTEQLEISSFTEEDKDSGPMILGSSTYGVTPYELAGAYMMFGNGGTFTTLHCYESVQTGAGREILVPDVETKQVLDSDTAYVMNRLLRGVMEGNGTAAGYSVGGSMDSIGKTGTSSDNRDYWFVGLTPYYVTATWYGYDSGFALNTSAGTHAPTSAWRYVMRKAQNGLETKEFPVDSTVVQEEYCLSSGGIATANCPRTATGYYQADNLPGMCTEHAA